MKQNTCDDIDDEDWEDDAEADEDWIETEREVPDGYVLLCEGWQGNPMFFYPGFEVIENVHHLLGSLEELGEKKVNWKRLLKGLKYFEPLAECNFPPLYNIEEIEILDGFDSDVREPQVDTVCATYNWVDVYIKASRIKGILRRFETLEKRLQKLLTDEGI